MPSRIDEAGHTKAFDDPVAEHWGENQRAKRSLVGFEPTSAHTYESEIQRSTTYATPTSRMKLGIPQLPHYPIGVKRIHVSSPNVEGTVFQTFLNYNSVQATFVFN